MGLRLVFGNVDNQFGRLRIIQEPVDVPPQFQEAAVVSCDGRVRQVKFFRDRRVNAVRVIPDHKREILYLLRDQGDDVLGHNAHTAASRSMCSRTKWPMPFI